MRDDNSKNLSWGDNSDRNLATLTISDFLKIAIFAKYFCTLNFPLSLYDFSQLRLSTPPLNQTEILACLLEVHGYNMLHYCNHSNIGPCILVIRNFGPHEWRVYRDNDVRWYQRQHHSICGANAHWKHPRDRVQFHETRLLVLLQRHTYQLAESTSSHV